MRNILISTALFFLASSLESVASSQGSVRSESKWSVEADGRASESHLSVEAHDHAMANGGERILRASKQSNSNLAQRTDEKAAEVTQKIDESQGDLWCTAENEDHCCPCMRLKLKDPGMSLLGKCTCKNPLNVPLVDELMGKCWCDCEDAPFLPHYEEARHIYGSTGKYGGVRMGKEYRDRIGEDECRATWLQRDTPVRLIADEDDE